MPSKLEQGIEVCLTSVLSPEEVNGLSDRDVSGVVVKASQLILEHQGRVGGSHARAPTLSCGSGTKQDVRLAERRGYVHLRSGNNVCAYVYLRHEILPPKFVQFPF